MSLLPFARNFFAVQGNNAALAVTKALVQMDPEAASMADLKTMEEDLDKAGRVIAKLREDLANEQREYDQIKRRYNELMGAAEALQTKINGAPQNQTSLEQSLASLLDKIEHVSPELDRDKHDVEQTQVLLTEAEQAYQSKASALVSAKGNLERARHDLQHANIERERSEQRAQQAAVVAGLTTSPLSGLTVALNTMQESAKEAREKADAANMKADALKHSDAASEDPNIAQALQEVRGKVSPQTLSERLAALRK